MARIRSVKPEFFQDQDLAVELPNRDARLLYIGLWGLADEHGRLRGESVGIKGQLFAYDADLTPEIIEKLIDMLEETGRAMRYRVRNSVYLFLPKLAEHQRLDSAKVPSRLPPPPADLLELYMSESSENFPDKSENRANKSAPKQAASSKKHEASSRGKIREESGPENLPPGSEQATRLIVDATDAPAYLAAEAVLAIVRERQPRNLPGLTRTLIDRGEITGWLAKAKKAIEAESVANTLAVARASPPCKHGDPGGDLPHPVSGKPICPQCRAQERQSA